MGQQLKINRIRGRFARFSGAVRLAENIERSQLEFTVDATSLVSDTSSATRN
jgi:polyisoprenoid-binding protein YceI